MVPMLRRSTARAASREPARAIRSRSRWVISWAALRVKVNATLRSASPGRDSSSPASRSTRQRVLPDPAAAETHTTRSEASMMACCAGVIRSRSGGDLRGSGIAALPSAGAGLRGRGVLLALLHRQHAHPLVHAAHGDVRAEIALAGRGVHAHHAGGDLLAQAQRLASRCAPGASSGGRFSVLRPRLSALSKSWNFPSLKWKCPTVSTVSPGSSLQREPVQVACSSRPSRSWAATAFRAALVVQHPQVDRVIVGALRRRRPCRPPRGPPGRCALTGAAPRARREAPGSP